MRSNLDLDLIFPIADEPSARLMVVKAQCLYAAGVIDEEERQAVFAQAAAMRPHDTQPIAPALTPHDTSAVHH